MTSIQKIGKLLLLLLITGSIFSCNKNDDIPPFQFIGDVFISKKKINEDVKYANIYYAYGNLSSTSGKVVTPGDSTLQLEAANTRKSTYRKETTASDYSTEKPKEGDYKFTLVNEGVEYTETDKLSYADLEIPVIDSINLEKTSQKLTVKWAKVDKADSYLLTINDSDNKTIYSSGLLKNKVTSYDVIASSRLWKEAPSSSKNYKIELRAFKYEVNLSNPDFVYNIQEMVETSKNIVWE